MARLDQCDLGWVGADGFPLPVPVTGVEELERGFRLRLGATSRGRPRARPA